MDLEAKVKEYIRANVKEQGLVALPVSKIANEIDSSTATVWRALQRLEDKRIIKVVRPRLKTQPNAIYYLGEEDELQATINRLIDSTGNMLIVLKELKSKIKEKDDTIFDLQKQLNKR